MTTHHGAHSVRNKARMMILSIDKSTMKAWLCSFKACLPWGCLYIPFRAGLSLSRIALDKSIWRIGESLRLRSLARLPDGNKLFFRPFSWDHEAFKEIYGYRCYEKLFRIREGDVVIDVGAHIGIFTMKAARLTGKKGVVVAIEPDRENYQFLMVNKKLNNLENVIPVYGALSDYCGKAHLYSWKGMTGGYSIVEKHSSHYVEVPVFTLDYLARKLGLFKVDFVKIDAEGAELEVLKGSKETLQRSSAKVVIAGYHVPDDPKAISYFIESLGYKAFVSESNFIYACK